VREFKPHGDRALMSQDAIQVRAAHYDSLSYDGRERWMSYWHQAHQVLQAQPGDCLEIGVGNGTVSRYLRAAGVPVTSVDFDAALKPDVVADVRDLPFGDLAFDVVLCAEVLEHLPFGDVPQALQEVARVTRRRAVFSIPVFTRSFWLWVRIPPFRPFRWTGHLPARRGFSFDGQHYWEMGARNYPRRVVVAAFERSFVLQNQYVVPENPYHYFLIGEPRR
jgi:SAM-dependent methyltransferase